MYYLCIASEQTGGYRGPAPVFFVADGHSAGAGGPSQAALGKNYQALRKNYKADSFFYPPDSCSQAALSWHKPVTKLLPKVINVNATMHFGA